MTESEIVGKRYLLKMHFVRAIEDRLEKTPDLTFGDWIDLTTGGGKTFCALKNGGIPECRGLDLDDLIWCWRKATREA